jgi:hypothetical protein
LRELHTAEDWYRRTALTDQLQLKDEQVNKDRLYHALDGLQAELFSNVTHLREAN